MFAQLTLMSLGVIILAIYLFVIEPIRQAEANFEPEPLAQANYTRGTAYQIRSAISLEEGTELTKKSRALLEELKRSNPQLRYHFWTPEKEVVFGEPSSVLPQFLEQQQALGIDIATDCVISTKYLPAAPGLLSGVLEAQICTDSHFVIEVSGLSESQALQSGPPPAEASTLDVLTLAVANQEEWLLAPAGVFLIAVLVLILHFISVRKLARAAEEIDLETGYVELPLDTLPIEAQPLGQAVNKLIARTDKVRKRERFFLSAAAHEMRSPLTGLRTRLEFIADEKLKEDLIRDVNRIIKLVNQLLQLSKLGNAANVIEYFDLKECCQLAAERVPSLKEMVDVEVVFSSDVDAYPIWGDRNLINAALTNLVENALDFSRAGARVSILLDASGTVTVEDEGPGINREVLSEVFTPFSKYPPNRNGHGLGLAIVKAIVELHGGTVFAENANSAGARIGFTLPHAEQSPTSLPETE